MFCVLYGGMLLGFVVYYWYLQAKNGYKLALVVLKDFVGCDVNLANLVLFLGRVVLQNYRNGSWKRKALRRGYLSRDSVADSR